MALSEIVRFTLPPTSSAASKFLKLRNYISQHGGVREQYFGSAFVPPSPAALPVKKNEMCWVIQWPLNSDVFADASFRTQLLDLAKKNDGTSEEEAAPKSLLFEFDKESQISELRKALEAPICEFAIINLSPSAPRSNTDFQQSMHKTYTDCYRMRGFVGGNWAYAINTNDTSGTVLTDGTGNRQLSEIERKLACYYLGWQSVEAHQDAGSTTIFEEEMAKLRPWLGEGSGMWYAKFEKYP